jgi:hypothetical protein
MWELFGGSLGEHFSCSSKKNRMLASRGGGRRRFAARSGGLLLLGAIGAGVPTTGLGKVQIEGDANALRVTTSGETVSDVLAALCANFNVQYRSSISLDRAVRGTYSGSATKVIGRLLDGLDFVVKNDGDLVEITVFGRTPTTKVAGAVPVAPPGAVGRAVVPPFFVGTTPQPTPVASYTPAMALSSAFVAPSPCVPPLASRPAELPDTAPLATSEPDPTPTAAITVTLGTEPPEAADQTLPTNSKPAVVFARNRNLPRTPAAADTPQNEFSRIFPDSATYPAAVRAAHITNGRPHQSLPERHASVDSSLRRPLASRSQEKVASSSVPERIMAAVATGISQILGGK